MSDAVVQVRGHQPEPGSVPPLGWVLSQLMNRVFSEFLELLLGGAGVWLVEAGVGVLVILVLYLAALPGILAQDPQLIVIGAGIAALFTIPLTVVVTAPLRAGLARAVWRKLTQGEELSFGSPFRDWKTDLGRVIGLALILEGLTLLGFFCGILPAVIPAILFVFAEPLVVVHKLPIGEALRRSFAHARAHLGWHAGFFGLGFLMETAAGQIPVIGAILVQPGMWIWRLTAYRVIFGDGASPRD
jgi:hypothetical protein